MALSSLPDLLHSPVGRPRVELPIALSSARPALQSDDGGGNLLLSDEEIEPEGGEALQGPLAEAEVPHEVKEIHDLASTKNKLQNKYYLQKNKLQQKTISLKLIFLKLLEFF